MISRKINNSLINQYLTLCLQKHIDLKLLQFPHFNMPFFFLFPVLDFPQIYILGTSFQKVIYHILIKLLVIHKNIMIRIRNPLTELFSYKLLRNLTCYSINIKKNTFCGMFKKLMTKNGVLIEIDI